jgi:hypothetical protein
VEQDYCHEPVTTPTRTTETEKESAMSLFVIALVAVAAAVVVAALTRYLTDVVRDDGAHGARRTPPASHHADPFDPRSRLA